MAGFLEGDERIAVWVIALAIDYVGPAVIDVGRGWRVAREHFAERHALIILIALGESMIALGVGAGFELTSGVIAGAALGIVVVSALWWLYFDVAAILARRRLLQATSLELHRLALHSYSYLHLPMVAGIILFAFGLKTTLGHVGEALETVPTVGLCAGAGLYLLGHIALLFRTTGIPALAALGLVSAVCALVVAYEAIRYRGARFSVRHPKLAQ